MFGRLRARVLAVVALALIPSFVLLLASAAAERQIGIERALEAARSTANLVADQQSALVASTSQLLGFVTSLMDRPVTNTAGCDIGLARIISGTNAYLGLSISGADGFVQCAAPRLTGPITVNNTDRLFFRRAVASKQMVVGGYIVGRLTGRPALAMAAPVIDRTGEITAVVAAGIDLVILNERMAAALPDDVVVLVTDDRGTVIAHHPNATEWLGRDLSESELIRRIEVEREGSAYIPNEDGDGRWHVFTTVGDPAAGTGALYVDVSYMQRQLFAAADSRLRQNLLTLLGGTIVALGLAWFGATYMISRPAQRLIHVVQRLRAGDWSARASLPDSTEFGRLGAAFDEMADTLQTHDRDLQSLNAELEDRVARRSAALERTNERLRASRSELRRLSRELLEIGERERTRLSREVYDQIGQALTGLKMDISAARRRLQQSDVDGANASLTSAMKLVDETVGLARRIALDLRPSLLDDFGLSAAVEWQLEDFSQRSGVRHTLSMNVDEGVVSPALATAAFRILKEALTNIARHASARTVDVRLATDASHLTLVIRDDGRGVTEDELTGPHTLGLLGMRERARQLGGRVTVVGERGQGTVVTLILPLETPDSVDTEEDPHDESTDR
ncbi:MAG: HAMP domain-containing protein [Ardenticatenales bacterium]|nr:HAMP domain-containing protein [Ardenticatenales bacterium]